MPAICLLGNEQSVQSECEEISSRTSTNAICCRFSGNCRHSRGLLRGNANDCSHSRTLTHRDCYSHTHAVADGHRGPNGDS